MQTGTTKAHVVSLLSGGLDSILAAKLLERQRVQVTCLHFYTPFFGFPEKVAHWEAVHGLTIRTVDICDDFVNMLVTRPDHGFGKVLNPCVDCKILMLRKARIIMEELGACAIATGEVLGQRPMSQRRDSLNIIQNEAGIKGLLLRPLTAQYLEPTQAELDGYIDREQLLAISGRGRKDQLALAKEFNLLEIPSPAGGCRLAETEVARNYWQVLKHLPSPASADFFLAGAGRQFWATEPASRWLVIGRDQATNDIIMKHACEQDMLFKVQDFAGPVALGRGAWGRWTEEMIQHTASLVASYSPKAMRHSEENSGSIAVRVHYGNLYGPGFVLDVLPQRSDAGWKEAVWVENREEVRAEARAAAQK